MNRKITAVYVREYLSPYGDEFVTRRFSSVREVAKFYEISPKTIYNNVGRETRHLNKTLSFSYEYKERKTKK